MPIAFQQPQELRNLALEKGTRACQLGPRAALPRHVAELGQAGRVGQADLVAHLRVPDVGLVDLAAGIEVVHLFHQVEDHPEHVEVVAAGDEPGMRDVGAGQGALCAARLHPRRPRS